MLVYLKDNLPGIMGKISMLLAILVISMFILRRVERKLFPKNKIFLKLSKISSKMHPYAATLLFITAGVHGYLQLGGEITFHSGYLVYFSLIITAVMIVIWKKTKQKKWLTAHKISALLFVIALGYHTIG